MMVEDVERLYRSLEGAKTLKSLHGGWGGWEPVPEHRSPCYPLTRYANRSEVCLYSTVTSNFTLPAEPRDMYPQITSTSDPRAVLPSSSHHYFDSNKILVVKSSPRWSSAR